MPSSSLRFPREVRAVVFDMDGLLLDTEKPVRAATFKLAEAVGKPMDEATYATLIGRTYAGVREGLLRHFGPETLEDFGVRWREFIDRELAGGVRLMAGVTELLDHLDGIGLPAAVATSTARARAVHHLERAGIAHRFRTVVGGDDVAQGKPHPEPYLKAAAALSADPAHCLALEDSHNGIRAAHAAGMMAVMVPDLLPATEEIRPLCHHVALDLHEVRAMLGA